MSDNPLPCSNCKYNGFSGLVQSCRHPEHPQPISGPLMLRIFGGCSNWVDWDKKVNSAEEISWPKPVNYAEVDNERSHT